MGLALSFVVALVWAALAMGSGAAGAAECGLGDGSRECEPLQAVDAQASTAEEQLAAKYGPIVYLKEQEHDCDGKGEAYYPAPVETVLGNPDVVLRDGKGNVVAEAPTAGDLYGKGEEFYLDFPGDPRRPGCDYEEDFKALAPSHPPVVYAHLLNDPGTGQIVVQYWFYYYFNDWNNKHESDWEMIQLVFDATSAANALKGEPASVAYAQHESGLTLAWNDGKVRKEDGRPAVYVGSGSHATQYRSGIFLGKGEAGSGFGCDDASDPSRRVDPEVRLIPNDISGPDDPFAWIEFRGRWGQKEGGYLNGPTGPATKDKWHEPLAWQEGLHGSSIKVPQETIGPNVATVFCGVVAGGSKLLFAAGPYVVLGLVVVALASVAVTVRRTQFKPVVLDPLRRRRRFGQIMRAAFQVERAHLGLFLGIGAVHVLAGAAVAPLQQFIFQHQPVEPVIEILDSSVAGGIIALAMGGLAFGVAYWVVVATVVSALGEIEGDRRVGVFAAYRMLWGNLWALLSARLRALAVVLLLGITVIGMPWAVWQAVRWTFLEQAVVLEGRSAREARDASARLVSGQWWRTLGVTIAVAYAAIAAGPIVGIVILLFTSSPLSFINLISSVIYVALVPYAAIALTMLYYDLQTAKEAPAGRVPPD